MCEVIGTVILPLQLKDTVQLFEVLVVPTVSHAIILNDDFWLGMNIIPHSHSRECHFKEDNNSDF